jgi:hypothetical protein
MSRLLIGPTIALALAWSFVLRGAAPMPGDDLVLSCQAFPSTLTEADLIARFGAENVTTAPVFGSDDGPEEGTVVFPAVPDARLEIGWTDRVHKRYPGFVTVKSERSRWKTRNGLTIGVDLLTLERRNGRPFRMAGFWTQRQGAVLSWANGRLAEPEPQGCMLLINLQPRYDGTGDSLMRQVRSIRELSSGHPVLQKLNPSIVRIWIIPSRQAVQPRARANDA